MNAKMDIFKGWAIFVVLLAVMGLPALAGTYSGGIGTAADPYLISTAEDMNAIGANTMDWGKHFLLTADIDLSAYTGTQFNIIGTSFVTPFTGVFDGNDHTISNFTYTSTATAHIIGLFGYVDDGNAVIKDLTLITPDVNAAGYSYYVGGIVGNLKKGTITGCGVDGGSVSGFYEAGGLVGYNGGTILNCYAAGSVSGTNYTGGLAGYNYYGTISNCYAGGSVTGTTDTGGLVGRNEGTISNCYSTASVTGTGDYIGGLVGNGGGALNCFWDVETSGQVSSAGGTGKTTAEMKTASTFFGWAGCGSEEVWTIDDGQDYPRLAWEGRAGQPFPAQQLGDFLAGSGTASDPYRVYTAEQFNLVGLFICEWDRHFLLANDIDLSGFTGTGFNVIGTASSGFTGVFDGDDHTISNFTYTTTNKNYIGLFDYVDDANAVIKNLTLVDANIHMYGYSDYVGSLVGNLKNGTITGCGVDGGSVSGEDLGIGGLVGYNDKGTISNCYATASITGDSGTGGLVGENGGTISNCYATGSVTKYGTEFGNGFATGGLVGCNFHGTISDCYATGNITGNDGVGGLVGANFYGTISNCCATGSITGDIFIGGLVGGSYGPAIVNNCFWDIDTTGQASSAGGEGKTTEQMQTQSTFTDAGWDFVGEVVNGPNDIWDICEGTNYPKLAWQIPAADFVCPDGVNFADYAFLTEHWMETDYGDLGGIELSGDGKLNLTDFAFFAGYWQFTDCGTCGGADFTGDGNVDSADIGVFADHWLATDYGDCGGAELTGDGAVNILDFAVLAENWLKGL